MTRRLTVTRNQDPFPVVTIGDVAVRTDQKVDTVKHWIHRDRAGVPAPIAMSVAGALYWWPDWATWLHDRRPKIWKETMLLAMHNAATPDSDVIVAKPGPLCGTSLVASCADCDCTEDECDLRGKS
jgi:hypothetical protein